jgi:hypothetical protein
MPVPQEMNFLFVEQAGKPVPKGLLKMLQEDVS